MKQDMHELPDEAYANPHTRTYPYHTKEDAQESLRKLDEDRAKGDINETQHRAYKGTIDGALKTGKFPGMGTGGPYGGQGRDRRPDFRGRNRPETKLSEHVRSKRPLNSTADRGLEGHAARGKGRQLTSDDDADDFPIQSRDQSQYDRTRND